MWLAANEHPDFRTLNLFRSKEDDLLLRVPAVLHYCAAEAKIGRLVHERITRFAGNLEEDLAEAELFAKRIMRRSRLARQEKRPNWFTGVVDPEHIVSIVLADCQPIVN